MLVTKSYLQLNASKNIRNFYRFTNAFLPIFVATHSKMKRLLILVFGLVFLYSCNNNNNSEEKTVSITNSIEPPQTIPYTIVGSHPHDTSSYTQGLIWYNNALYESTGMEGHSRLMKTDLQTGKVLKSVDLTPEFFGEGITILNDKIYQLTWQNHKVFVYDVKTFKKIGEFAWEHDGWGITDNGTDIIISTGESNLYFIDPASFKIKKIIGVFDNNGPVGNLNELEYIDGSIYSNIYLTDYIVRIDASNGHITGKMDFNDILAKAGKQVDTEAGYVLNGIAYDKLKNTLLITGKKWPLLFELKINK